MFILRQGKLCLYLGSAKYVYSYAGGVLFFSMRAKVRLSYAGHGMFCVYRPRHILVLRASVSLGTHSAYMAKVRFLSKSKPKFVFLITVATVFLPP